MTDFVSDEEEIFYDLEDDTINLFKAVLASKNIPFKIQTIYVGSVKLKKLIEVKKTPEDKNKIFYTDILAKFHNPLTIENDLFKPCGFEVIDILFYHYHALPPIFEAKNPKLFKELSLKLEDPYDWKGNLMASTYLVVAKKINPIE